MQSHDKQDCLCGLLSITLYDHEPMLANDKVNHPSSWVTQNIGQSLFMFNKNIPQTKCECFLKELYT